jgi:methylenetetrahydrofolate reductase (NADPH)
MPVTNAAQIKRICSISGNALPQKIIRMVDRYGDNPEALKQAGIAYATEQIVDLYANGIDNVHVYWMNKIDVAKKIKDNVSEILK